LKDGHTHGFINFIGVLAYIYIAFFWTFGCLNSNLNYGYIKYTSNFLEENTWRFETPETMHVILGRTVHLGTLNAHHRLDLHLRCCQRCKKNKKNGKNMAWAHDLWCIHTKYTKFGIPRFWVMGASQPSATKNMKLRLACLNWPRWIGEDGFSKKHSELSNLGLSQITKHHVMKRWSNGCHWVIGFAPTITIDH
jgi:hypothetical protein